MLIEFRRAAVPVRNAPLVVKIEVAGAVRKPVVSVAQTVAHPNQRPNHNHSSPLMY